MFSSILHRMIFRELIRVFLLSLFGITGILLMAGIVAEATQQGLNPAQILAVIPLLIPSTLPYTIPATTLFATCVVYGRLAADNEVLAIRSSGINMTKVVWPGVVLGLVTSAATMGLYYHLIPSTHHFMRSMFLDDVEELLYTMLRRHNQITLPHLDYSIYVKGVQNKRLLNPIFKRRNSRNQTDLVAVAREAELHVDMHNQMIVVSMKVGEVWSHNGTTSQFEKHKFEVPMSTDLVTKGYRRPRDMTWQEMFRFEEQYEADLAAEKTTLARLEEAESAGTLSDFQKAPLITSRAKVKVLEHQLRNIAAEQHMRPALALGCLFFVLVGCPMGIWLSRSDYLSSFIACFLPIVLLYYPFILCGTTLAKSGRLAPQVTVWVGDLLMCVLGLLLFRRLLRH